MGRSASCARIQSPPGNITDRQRISESVDPRVSIRRSRSSAGLGGRGGIFGNVHSPVSITSSAAGNISPLPTDIPVAIAAFPMPAPISAIIIACNEIDRIEACIASVAFCDEILVVDSGSRDGTPELCRRLGCRVVHQPWLGYGPQKRRAVSLASHDWVLCVDADERVTPQLAESIMAALGQCQATAYEFPRCNRFLGRWLRHGEGYPDVCLRLFDRRAAQWSVDSVHEKVVGCGPMPFRVQRLAGDLMHESETTLEQYLAKQNRYTTLQAEELIRRGTRVSGFKVIFSPVVRFIKFYFVRGGFRDGLPGLLHIAIGCFNSLVKYAKVWAAQTCALPVAQAPSSLALSPPEAVPAQRP